MWEHLVFMRALVYKELLQQYPQFDVKVYNCKKNWHKAFAAARKKLSFKESNHE